MEIVPTLDKRKKNNCISQNVKLLICIQLQNSSSNSKSEQWEISIHTHTKKQQPCFPPDKHRNLLFSDGFHQIELEEVLNSKVILWCLRVRTHLQTQLVTQQSSFFKQLGPVLLGLTESDWLLTGSLHCVESPVEVRRAGSVLEVRGQTKAENYWHHVLTHMSSVPTIWHCFLSPRHSIFWLCQCHREENALQCE